MELLASCSLEQSKTFNGKLEIPNDTGKPDIVKLNIVVPDKGDDIFNELTGKVDCITFTSNWATWCPENYSGKVYNQYSLEQFENGDATEVYGITNLVVLPEGYCDMRKLREYCNSNPTVRFTGGNLLQIEGVRIGRTDRGKEKISSIFNEVYDAFLEVDLSDLTGIEEKVRKARIKLDTDDNSSSVKKGVKKSKSGGVKKSKEGGSTKEPVEKRPPKRVAAFNSMFGSGGEDF